MEVMLKYGGSVLKGSSGKLRFKVEHIIKGINDLETWCKQNDREYILEEWDALQNGELTPDMVTWGSHKRVHWKCKKGHMWEAVVKERTKIRGNRCPECRKEL